MPKPLPNNYVERETGIIKTEKIAEEKWLVWLYNNPVGKASMFGIVKRKFISTWYGDEMDSESSGEKIEPFIEEFNIDMNIAKTEEYNSFNDFFYRKLKKSARPVDTNSNVIVSPADGKILAYSNINNTDFIIKGARFDVNSFLDNQSLANKYSNGSLIIVRLAPYDYHRFHFPVSGYASQPTLIEGDLYSVNPIALRQMVEIFFLNKREYVSIVTNNFGDVIMAEVGATMVGSIIQTYKANSITKGAEKGYFKFGGSTVVLLFEKDKIIIDTDLLENTANGLETEVKMGEKIGEVDFKTITSY
ncbi:MAG: phosphatidylserine decarboxylase [Bacteroidota bacterium]